MDIRDYLTRYFQKPQINNIIVSYFYKQNLKYQNLSNEQLIKMLEDLQLLEPLLEQINSNTLNQDQDDKMRTVGNIQLQSFDYQSQTSKSTINVNFKSGRKFKSFPKLSPNIKFFISIVAFNQKSKTSPLPANSQSFPINETLKFSAYQNQLKSDNNCPLQMSLILLNAQTGENQLYSVKLIEWRYLLCYGSASFEIELAPYFFQGTKQMQAIGIVSIQLVLKPINKLSIVTQKCIQNQIQLQKKQKQRQNNEFYKQATDFWNQYKQIHRSFTTRRVKLYANCQDKILIPLPKIIKSLYNLKGIQSPNHALRFCSLLGFENQNHINHNNSYHKRYSSFLANKKGTVDDHCNLLCGILLGFGLRAYVAIGYSLQDEHSWVITTSKDNITFWECTKGLKFDYFSPKTFKFYKSVHVVYNNSEYYANIQLDDSISGTKFNFNDKNLWKCFPSNIITDISPYNRQLALNPPSLDVYNVESDLQKGLQSKIKQFRKKNKLSSTNFDDILNSILTTALTNYQWQRISGVTFCQQEFQNAIKSYIPLNHTFKAFPIQLTTLKIEQIMDQLTGQGKCRQILLSKGDSIFFGLRCKLVNMADNVIALWISVAVRYFKLQT